METVILFFFLLAVAIAVAALSATKSVQEQPVTIEDWQLIERGDTGAIARCLGKRLNGIRIDEVRFADDTTLCVGFRPKRFEIADRRYGVKSRRLFQACQYRRDVVDVIYASLDLVHQAKTVIASGYDELIDDKGWPYLGCVISVRATRKVAESLNPHNLLPTEVLAHFEHRENVDHTTGTIGTIEPLEGLGSAPDTLSPRDQQIIELFSSLKAAETSDTGKSAATRSKTSFEDFILMMQYELSNRRVEYEVVSFFDGDRNLIDWEEIKGHSVWVETNSAVAAQLALAKAAKYVAEFHNHPNPGASVPLLEPSDADFQSSYALWKSCKAIGIELLGCYIVSKRRVREYFFSTCRRLNIPLDDPLPTEEADREGVPAEG